MLTFLYFKSFGILLFESILYICVLEKKFKNFETYPFFIKNKSIFPPGNLADKNCFQKIYKTI